MSEVVSEMIIRINADASGFLSGLSSTISGVKNQLASVQNAGGGAFSGMTTGMTNAQRAATNTANTMRETAGSINELGGSMGALNGPASAVENMMDGLITKAVGLASAYLSVKGAQQAIQAYAGMESASVAFEVMTGSADKALMVLGDLRDFANTTPFEFPELRTGAQLLMAFGTEAEDLVPTLRMLGDISSAMQMPVKELASIYGKAQVQGRMYMQDIFQFQGRGIPIMTELAKVMGTNEAAIRKLVEEGKVGFKEMQMAMTNMTSEGGKFYNMTVKQAQTLDGLWSTFKDAKNSLMVNIGENLTNSLGLKEILRAMISMADGVVEASKNLFGLADALNWVGYHLAEIKGAVLSFGTAFLVFKAATVGAGLLATTISALTRAWNILNIVMNTNRAINCADSMMKTAIATKNAADQALVSTLIFNRQAIAMTAVKMAAGGVVLALAAMAVYYVTTYKTSADKFVSSNKQLVDSMERQISVIKAEKMAGEAAIKTMEAGKQAYLDTGKAADDANEARDKLAKNTKAVDDAERSATWATTKFGEANIHANSTTQSLKNAITALGPTLTESEKQELETSKNKEETYNKLLTAKKAQTAGITTELRKLASANAASTQVMIENAVKEINTIKGSTEAYGIWAKVKTDFYRMSAKGHATQAEEARRMADEALEHNELYLYKRYIATAENLDAMSKLAKDAADAEVFNSKQGELDKVLASIDAATSAQGRFNALLKDGGTTETTKETGGETAPSGGGAKSKAQTEAEKYQAALKILKNELEALQKAHSLAFSQMAGDASIVDKFKAKQSQLSAEMVLQQKIVDMAGAEYEKQKAAMGDASKASDETREKVLGLEIAYTQEKIALEELNRQVAENIGMMVDQASKLDDLADTFKALDARMAQVAVTEREEMAKSLADYQQKSADVSAQLASDIEAVENQYKDSFNSMKDSIANFVGIFGVFENKEVSADTLIANLQNQADTLKSWQENLGTLKTRGVSDALMGELMKLGPSSANEIAAMVTMTDEQLIQYGQLYTTRGELANQAATAATVDLRNNMVAEIDKLNADADAKLAILEEEWKTVNEAIKENTKKELDEINKAYKTAQDAAEAAGIKLVDRLARGMDAELPKLQGAVSNILTEIQTALDAIMGADSGIVNAYEQTKAKQISTGLFAVGGEIPGAAKGGLVTRPTILLVGEAGPEIIVPLNQASPLNPIPNDLSMPAGRQGNVYNFGDIHIEGSNGEELFEDFRRKLVRQVGINI